MPYFTFFFFFSSRRRHTRYWRDWSSDVCSSDLQFPRDYSYAMNCGLCHESDPARFLAPTRTLLFMEADLARNDYSGQVGPSMATRALATRHNHRGHLIFGALHLEKLRLPAVDQMVHS